MEGINLKGERSFQIHDSHFFKVILFPSDQGLKIPDAFMRKYGCDLEDIVVLKVPTGATWQVELVRNEINLGGTLLHKGWERFAEFYFIEKHYFLVFEYEGNSQFHVFIFDQTALEIEYPVETNCDRNGYSSGSEDDEHDEELEDEISATRASRRKGKRPHEESASIEVLLDDDEDNDTSGSGCKPKARSKKKLMIVTEKQRKNIAAKTDDTNSGCPKKNLNKGKRPLKCSTIIDKKKYKSYKRAQTFTSSNPFFVSFMQPSYVGKTVSLEIPIEFSQSYLSTEQHESYSLMRRVSGRRIMSWPVIVSPRFSKGARIFIGWKKFVQDNGLKVGNVCVFELMPGTRKFNVTVY